MTSSLTEKTHVTSNRLALLVAAGVAVLAIATIAPTVLADTGDVVAEPTLAEQEHEPMSTEAARVAEPGSESDSPSPADADISSRSCPSTASCEPGSVDCLDGLAVDVVETSQSCYSQGWECGVNQDPNCGGLCRCTIVVNGCGYCPC